MYPYDDLQDDQASNSNQALKRLVDDPLYWREQDPEYRSYVDDSFKTVYGDAAAEQDATGRMVEPEARPAALPAFRPAARPDDLELGAGVGESQPNSWRDVFKVQKGLANTGHYTLDMRKEKSGEHSLGLAQAIREFQREKRDEIDGVLLPGGPTIKRIGESLFGAAGTQATKPARSSRYQDGSLAALPQDATVEKAEWTKPRTDRSGAGESDSGVEVVQFAGPRPRQALPERRPDSTDNKKWGTLPSEQPTGNPGDSPYRAVIVRMPDGKKYILLEPTPRELRIKNKSDFQLHPGTSAHRVPFEMAKARYPWAIPMTQDEAKEALERAARGQIRSGDDPYRARIPLQPPGGETAVRIRYYLPDGRHEDALAKDPKTGEVLYAPGSEPVLIAAEDALKLGLHDWMQIKLPDRKELPPLPLRRIDPLGLASFAARLFQFWDAFETNRGREQFFSKTPRDAEPTWR